MNGYYPVEQILGNSPVTVGASQTLAQVSNEFRINPEGSLHFRIDVEVSAATVATGISLILQTTSGNDAASWVTAKSTTVTTTGLVSQSYVVEVAADQTYLPLRPKGKLLCTTGAGDSVTLSSIRIMQEE